MPSERWRDSYDNWKLASPDDERPANDNQPLFGDCDCCDRQNVPLYFCVAYQIETFACEDCRS